MVKLEPPRRADAGPTDFREALVRATGRLVQTELELARTRDRVVHLQFLVIALTGMVLVTSGVAAVAVVHALALTP